MFTLPLWLVPGCEVMLPILWIALVADTPDILKEAI
jgi:hypothetical protein